MSDIYETDPITGYRLVQNVRWNEIHDAAQEASTPLEAGLRRGMARCSRGMPATEQHHQRAEDVVKDLFTQVDLLSQSHWSPRGKAYFVELITVGTYARVVNDEPPMTVDQVRRYALWSEEMSNSWFHL